MRLSGVNGAVSGQHYKVDKPEQLRERLDNLCADLLINWNWEKPLRIDWKEYKDARSLDQNAFWQIVSREIAKKLCDTAGEDYDSEAHEWCKGILKRRHGLVRTRWNPIEQKDLPYLVSTKDYEKGELHDLISRCLEYAAEIGLIIEIRGEYKDLRESQYT